ncbi:anthocyanidin 3-O-glucosyltransferase-like [Olea europaea subsp. europaea]|uniref:Anthocyanidin 3-O-glucosyltransferase-like n=1 Tax=Olea europaea subsp. europaea TaxID=158383 RepID=A0A8S0VGS9_OLEEU|nr:anthocyanidin 3-O-glucosyltransferase-like [Olea europaea subsp. europaea]
MAFHAHIGVLAFPFGSHAAPLLTLVRRLAAASSSDIIFSFFNTEKSNCAIFSGQEFDNIKAYDVWDGTPEGEAFSGSHFEAMQLFLDATPGNFEKAMKEAESESGVKISCLLTDAFLWFACDMAEERRVPWVALWTSSSCSLSAHMYTDQIWSMMRSTGVAERKEKTLSFVPGMSSVRFSDLPGEILPEKSESPLAIMIYKMVQKLPKSTAVVLNSFEEIDPLITTDLKSKFRNFLNIHLSILSGDPSILSEDSGQECLSWLEKQRHASVVYISFGTVTTPQPEELAALAEVLETGEFPFLWSMKDNAKKLLPEGFLNRTSKFGMIVSWAPQLKVLENPSVGIFMTHCGWNSVSESISCGVPMICRPFLGDQSSNSRMVEAVWKIGVRIEGGVFTKKGTIEALHYIMSNETGKAIRENVNKLKQKAENAVKLDGSSTKNFKALLELLKSSRGV